MAITSSPDVIPIGTPRRGGGRSGRSLEQAHAEAQAEIRSLRRTLAAVTSGVDTETPQMPAAWSVAYSSAQGDEQVVMIDDRTAAILGPAGPGDTGAARAWRMIQKLLSSGDGKHDLAVS